MATVEKKWWWEGYAALAWSLLLWIWIVVHANAVAYVCITAYVLSPLGLMFGISAVRRGSPLAKAAAAVALLLAAVFIFMFILTPRY